MELYAIYKDGQLKKASYDQNTPFYDNLNGAQKAMRYLIRSACEYGPDLTPSKRQERYDKEAKRYIIKKFVLGTGEEI